MARAIKTTAWMARGFDRCAGFDYLFLRCFFYNQSIGGGENGKRRQEILSRKIVQGVARQDAARARGEKENRLCATAGCAGTGEAGQSQTPGGIG
jgi:hypothetical protein